MDITFFQFLFCLRVTLSASIIDTKERLPDISMVANCPGNTDVYYAEPQQTRIKTVSNS